MKVTLQLSDGREMTFSNVIDVSIPEKNLQIKETERTMEVAQALTEGKLFKVDPLAIDQALFKKKRRDSRQEETRQLILEAFEEMKKNSKYAKAFKTMMPEKTWNSKTVRELKELANRLGDHNADWVEQALEWAQRIANGESWEKICNRSDMANWYRLVVWKNGDTRLVGGSRKVDFYNSASGVSSFSYHGDVNVDYAVPLVVLYK